MSFFNFPQKKFGRRTKKGHVNDTEAHPQLAQVDYKLKLLKSVRSLKLKQGLMEPFFLKHTNDLFFVSGHSIKD